MLKLRTLFIVIICLSPLFYGFNCWWNRFGGAIYYSSKYSEKRLLGLTEQEVIKVLGSPSNDPRRANPWRENEPATRSWNVAEEGPLWLSWYRGWAHCVVRFQNGRVVKVEHGMK